MSFLPDVQCRCDACGGRRFNPETLEVRWREQSIGDVLAMTVERRWSSSRRTRASTAPLQLLAGVGPGLSDARASRARRCSAARRSASSWSRNCRDGARRCARAAARQDAHTLYVLEEPTVGLHMADVEKLHRGPPPAGGRRQHGGRHRAQPRHHGRGRLDHRSRSRGRRSRRTNRRRGHARSRSRARRAHSHTARVLDAFLRERTLPVAAERLGLTHGSTS